MALELSIEAESLLSQTNVEGNIVLEIENFPLFGSVKVTKVARIGEFVIGDGTLIGGTIQDAASKDYISLTGSTNNISQKIDIDRGGGSSITSFNIRLIDENNELSEIFSPGQLVDDPLGNSATVYFMANGSRFPQDAVRLFQGVISSLSFGSGFLNCRIDHPSQLSRQQILPQATTTLDGAINASQTLIPVDSIEGFVNAQDLLESYVRIDDEIIFVQAFSGNTLFNCVRGQFGTIATDHEDEAEVISTYRLQGGPIELALKILLSEPTNSEFATREATAIETLSTTETVNNAVFFPVVNIQDELGLVAGDLLSITAGSSNLISFTPILGFGQNSTGSYCIVDSDLSPETDITATVLFKSKYNTLSFGCAESIKPFNVDVEQFEDLETQFSSSFFTYDFLLEDTLDNFKEFLEEEILYPCAMFGLPRKGRISAGISAAPLIGPQAKTISADNVLNATALTLTRSINDYFYNSVVYKFNQDVLEDKFLGAVTTLSADSTNRINVGNRTLTIEARGVRESETNRELIRDLSERFLDRYQFAAEKIEVETDFKNFAIEPGDTCILDGEALQLTDISQGNRNFAPRIMECVDKSLSLKSGTIKLVLADVNQSLRVRYGVISGSSQIGTGSTTSELIIKRSFSTEDFELERDKWTDYINQKIRIYNEDYSFDEETTLIGFDVGNPNKMLINPALSVAPSEDFIIESPIYDDSSTQAMSFWKGLHCFLNPTVNATSGTTTTFDVDPSDIDKFLPGAFLLVHTSDYLTQANATVESVGATTVTLTADIGFTIDNTFVIDLIGYRDGGSPYAWY